MRKYSHVVVEAQFTKQKEHPRKCIEYLLSLTVQLNFQFLYAANY